MEQELISRLHTDFSEASQEVEAVEYMSARDLQKLLGYAKWDNFSKVIEKAKIACKNASQDELDHFLDVGKMVDIGFGSQREIDDILLTRYSCYLIAQNGDPRKNEVAFAMNYFAVQTRKQELVEQRLIEWERLQARGKLTESEKDLSSIIYQSGVDNQGFGRIRSSGDQALFGGFSTSNMKVRLKIPESRALADFLPTIVIKAKDFVNEITNFNIKKDNLRGENQITREHVKNNQDIRKVLSDRGIKPENLPAEEDIKKVERKVNADSKNILKEAKQLKTKGKLFKK